MLERDVVNVFVDREAECKGAKGAIVVRVNNSQRAFTTDSQEAAIRKAAELAVVWNAEVIITPGVATPEGSEARQLNPVPGFNSPARLSAAEVLDYYNDLRYGIIQHSPKHSPKHSPRR